MPKTVVVPPRTWALGSWVEPTPTQVGHRPLFRWRGDRWVRVGEMIDRDAASELISVLIPGGEELEGE